MNVYKIEDLPKRIYNGKKCIDWNNCIGKQVSFIYNSNKYILTIISYDNKISRLKVKYNNNESYIYTNPFLKGQIGKVIKKRTIDFKVEIGTIFKDNNRDMIIIDREYKQDKNKRKWKWYKYQCNKCGYHDGWIEENKLIKCHRGCSCCSGRTVVEGINDIPTTAPWMVKYFQGGYEEAKKYTRTSKKYITPICPNCGCINDKPMLIYNIFKFGFNCFCEGGGSYPEKVVYFLLKQLNINYIYQYTKKHSNWCGKYKYDFYFKLNNEEYIIETQGMQHYKGGFENCGGRTLEEEQENDILKKELAIHNGIKSENYIVIDCRYSEFEFIKNNIINSKLCDIFDLKNVDWIDIEEYSRKSLIKQVCNYWNEHNEINNEDLTTTIIGNIFNLNRNTITKYLKIGSNLNWCNYNTNEEKHKNEKSFIRNNEKPIKVIKNNIDLGNYPSIRYLANNSIKLFGIKLDEKRISDCCRKVINKYKGFTFLFI